MEYAKQGEFFNYIVKNTRLDEKEASMFFAQIINGVEYIHENKIAHRDLKPENLLLAENKLIKIIDFGLSNSFSGGVLLKTPCGSPCYAAPEMLLGKKYDGVKIDIWSCGIILYAMVCGFLPFEDEDNTKLYQQILECNLEFPFQHSEDCLHLIRRLLCKNPEERITIPEIKNHNFYKKGQNILEENSPLVLYNTELINSQAVAKMVKMGYKKDFVQKNVKSGEYNNITATYYLIYNQIKNQKLMRTADFQHTISNTISKTIEHTSQDTVPNKVQNTVQNTYIFNEISTSKTNITEMKGRVLQEEPLNNSNETGGYADEICNTEILSCLDRSNEDFLKDEKKNKPKNYKKYSKKVKQVSIDIVKSHTPSFKKILSTYQNKKPVKTHNDTENLLTDENNHETSKYIKTENNIFSKKCFTPTLSINKNQNSLKSIGRKTPITLTYNLFSIKKKDITNKPKNYSINFNNKSQSKAINNSNINNTTKYAYIKLNSYSNDPTKSKEKRSSLIKNKTNTARATSKNLSKEHKPKYIVQSPTKRNEMLNLINKGKQVSKPATSSYVKYLAYSTRYKNKSSSDNKITTNNFSNIKNVNTNNAQVKEYPSPSSVRIFTEYTPTITKINRETSSKSPLLEKGSSVNNEILITNSGNKPQSIPKNANFISKKPLPQSNFKTCLIQDTSFNIKEKLTKLCKSHKILIKEVKC